MFSPGVCHSVHKGSAGVAISGTRSLLGGGYAQVVCRRGLVCPDRDGYVQRGIQPGGYLGEWYSPPRYIGPGILYGMVTSRWYASYWNAFLSIIVKLYMCVRVCIVPTQEPVNMMTKHSI